MNKVINIHEAKTHLSRIVDEVAAGAEIIIAKAGDGSPEPDCKQAAAQETRLTEGENQSCGRFQCAARRVDRRV